MKKLLLLMVSVMVAISCQDKNPENQDGQQLLKVSIATAQSPAEGNSVPFVVECSAAWNVSIDNPEALIEPDINWINFTKRSGKAGKTDVILTTDPNPGLADRKATIKINSDEKGATEAVIELTQKGASAGTTLTASLSPRRVVQSKPFEVSGEKTTVQSKPYGLTFFGWGQQNDPRFTLNFPENTTNCKRVIMTYRMGGGPKGCSGYDHTTTFMVKYQDQWFEIARCFTPFGNAFDASFEKKYYFDVTEYLPMLKGATEFKLYFNGFDGDLNGRHHTAQLTFDLYSGTPERTTVFAHKLYDSDLYGTSGYRSFTYGVAKYDIEVGENLMSKRTVTLPAGVKHLQMKVVITGHGADQGQFLDRPGYGTKNAAEFDENSYMVKINGVAATQRGRIFTACGSNYAQAGTCYFDRGNWCPGNPGHIDIWDFYNINPAGETFDIDIDLERFKSVYKDNTDAAAKYAVQVDLFGYNK
ncbi:MAG: peptide-N-glycosidase F-related protein [Mucinivorans sp.]